MGMKFACRHLLCRRDLSCTKVNAVNRLSDGLDASFGLSGEGGSALGAKAQLSVDVSRENWRQVGWVETEGRSSPDWQNVLSK